MGTGDTGQLGLGEDIMERKRPALVSGVKGKVVAVAAGGMFTLCLTTDGIVWSFGCPDEGALGRPIEEEEDSMEPGIVSLPAGVKIVQITAGDSHSVALDDKGKVYYWGTFRDSSGPFGLSADDLTNTICKQPLPLAHHLNIKKIASGKKGYFISQGFPGKPYNIANFQFGFDVLNSNTFFYKCYCRCFGEAHNNFPNICLAGGHA